MFNPIQTSTRSHCKQKIKTKQNRTEIKKHVNERKIKMTNLRSEFFRYMCRLYSFCLLLFIFNTQKIPSKFHQMSTEYIVYYTIHIIDILPHRQIHLIF